MQINLNNILIIVGLIILLHGWYIYIHLLTFTLLIVYINKNSFLIKNLKIILSIREEEFTYPPLDIILTLLIGAIISCIGIFRNVKFNLISISAEYNYYIYIYINNITKKTKNIIVSKKKHLILLIIDLIFGHLIHVINIFLVLNK